MGGGLGPEEWAEKGWVYGQIKKMTIHKSRKSDSGSCERKELNNLISFEFSWFVLREWTEVAQKSYNKMTSRHLLRNLGSIWEWEATSMQNSHNPPILTQPLPVISKEWSLRPLSYNLSSWNFILLLAGYSRKGDSTNQEGWGLPDYTTLRIQARVFLRKLSKIKYKIKCVL